jgi:hypothetical protein
MIWPLFAGRRQATFGARGRATCGPALGHALRAVPLLPTRLHHVRLVPGQRLGQLRACPVSMDWETPFLSCRILPAWLTRVRPPTLVLSLLSPPSLLPTVTSLRRPGLCWLTRRKPTARCAAVPRVAVKPPVKGSLIGAPSGLAGVPQGLKRGCPSASQMAHFADCRLLHHPPPSLLAQS